MDYHELVKGLDLPEVELDFCKTDDGYFMILDDETGEILYLERLQ